MSSLVIGIAISLSSFVGLIIWHHQKYIRLCTATSEFAAMGQKIRPCLPMNYANRLYPSLMVIALVTLSLAIYALCGRFSDWDTGRVNEQIDYLVAAEITKSRQSVNSNPEDEIALLSLAESYAAGGMYAESVQTLNQLLLLKGDDAELFGMQATSMYYRDGRTIKPETSVVIAKALTIQNNELQTRLLLATDAYLNGKYQKAIDNWQQLLTNNSQPFNRDAINNAINKAQQKLDEGKY
ncbi:hypothetical protein [Shewanella marina]|uniref:hypothetical protein n=1 Tax=Shewanella marina TaxID=487319 RepID=UPI00047186D1|nr:hypothetical protein [Shewanella marina]